MFRTASRLAAELIIGIGALLELYLVATLLPGDSINLSVAGTITTMILIGAGTILAASPFWVAGRVRA